MVARGLFNRTGKLLGQVTVTVSPPPWWDGLIINLEPYMGCDDVKGVGDEGRRDNDRSKRTSAVPDKTTE
jgi:hypothetical protein